MSLSFPKTKNPAGVGSHHTKNQPFVASHFILPQRTPASIKQHSEPKRANKTLPLPSVWQTKNIFMKLPKVIADLIAAEDKYDSKAFTENFSDDAVVHDEGKTYHGKTEIRKWNEMTNSKYKTNYEPIEVTTDGDKIILSAKISGTFPGSPAIIKYHFETKNSKIISLQI